jgi:16S rRNA (cytosine1402-N4)-methyltransferase
MSYHTPVLLQETIEGLSPGKRKRFIDATFGGGGHTKRMIELGAEVLGIDTDPDAEKEAAQIHSPKFRFHRGNFRHIKEIALSEGFDKVDGILFDLGVSSHQLDTAPRGFSYKWIDAPFDLRLDQSVGLPASDIVNHESEEELKKIIGVFGEEESCGRIAHALAKSRIKKKIETTGDVLTLIQEELGSGNQYKTASKVFQAFRIAVNDELNSLKIGLEDSVGLVKPGGRIAVISFHSLEDRIVKLFFQKKCFSIITKKPLTAGNTEQRLNRRSRSAKLRIAEKI